MNILSKIYVVLGIDAHDTTLIRAFSEKSEAFEYTKSFDEALDGYAMLSVCEMEVH